jgi:hypothetical protein
MALIHYCTAKTLQLAGPDRFEWRTIDYVTFIGKTEPLEIVESLVYKGELSEEQRQMQGFYQLTAHPPGPNWEGGWALTSK